jgi:hypothetical protein
MCVAVWLWFFVPHYYATSNKRKANFTGYMLISGCLNTRYCREDSRDEDARKKT